MGYTSIYKPSSMPANAGLAADAKSLGNLKMAAGKDSKSAIQETAKQFESLFMRELLKSMREATVKSGMLDSPGGDLGADMLDQQFAVQMSGQPGGLSDIIALQLTRQMGGESAIPLAKGSGPAGALPAATTSTTSTTPTVKISAAQVTPARPMRAPTETQSNFVQQHSKVASEVEKATGIPAGFMMGQAGHETGWGKFEIKAKGGAPSHNLFGIKAGRSWTGKVAEITTTEFIDGSPQKRVARFRAYDSYADSFKDYARLINESPRYAKAREQTGSVHAFASGLQKAGYATDPDYAAKLSRAINTTLAIQRVQT
jgi:flagellar protein FlgJ